MPRPLVVADSQTRPRYRYLGSPEPLVFPEEAEVPESLSHLELRVLLFHLLSDYLGLDTTIGSDQFIYYAADDPKQLLAPDVYVKLAPRDRQIGSWKVWERGAPEVAVEIVSPSDASELPWQTKLARYHRLGVRELLRFDAVAPEGQRLRIWNRVDEVLVERVVELDRAPSQVLPLLWVTAPADGRDVTLRIAQEKAGEPLVATRIEARQSAEARIRELEAELRKRGGT